MSTVSSGGKMGGGLGTKKLNAAEKEERENDYLMTVRHSRADRRGEGGGSYRWREEGGKGEEGLGLSPP